MLSRFLPILFVAIFRDVAGSQQDAGQSGYIQQQQQRIPILYEAYYPEPRDLSAQTTRLQEIDKLRELTSELLGQEERLKQLASEIEAAAPEENVLAPRSQVLEYVFSRPVIPLNERVRTIPSGAAASKMIDDVGIASLTVSDEQQQQQPKHKIRHHHGEWLLRRLANQPR